jgi:tetratricopeptide (TPR) repeat protein
LVKPDQRVLRVNDPALRDPLTNEIQLATRRQQFKRALELTRKLDARYPKSPAAHALRGMFAMALRNFSEASAAFRNAVAVQPEFAFCHYGIAAAEYQQRHYSAALPHARRVTQLEPRAAAAWVFLSMCAEAAGNRQESLSAARRLTTLAPREPAAWVRLSKAEEAMGNRVAATQALRRAVDAARARSAARPAPRTR